MMGQSSSGSFALSGSKTNIIEMAIERRMKEIASVFVNDLFKETFALNGWDTSRLPQLVFEFPEDYDSEEFSKMIQRIGAVNMFPRTPETIAWIAKAMGFPDWQKFSTMSQEELDEMFTENETGAGEGMSEGLNNGTGKGNKNNSATNADNKA
jgi:phage gp29-like protein